MRDKKRVNKECFYCKGKSGERKEESLRKKKSVIQVIQNEKA